MISFFAIIRTKHATTEYFLPAFILVRSEYGVPDIGLVVYGSCINLILTVEGNAGQLV
jgi:hypothetical protein